MEREMFARRSLGCFPTPLHELPRLSEALDGPRLFIKRDDLTGRGMGGNKIRKLEFLLGEAIEQGCDTILTAGAAQSNHCRQTAAAAAACGLACHLALGGEDSEPLTGNLLLDHLLGAQIHWCGSYRKGETLEEIAEEIRREGGSPYVAPYGGSNATGAMGYVEASRELAGQLVERELELTHIVLASSSGGTQAGLIVGHEMFSLRAQIIGIQIDPEGIEGRSLSENVTRIANELACRSGLSRVFSRDEVWVESGYFGGGYGVVGEREREAIRLVASLEGILLDPVYTGRAMGGLIDLVRRGRFHREDSVLFWHTGGSPALFSHTQELSR